MFKDFDSWNEQKKKLHLTESNKLYHEREIWWCSLGVNVGFEQDGAGSDHQRPVLILKGLSRNTCTVLPLTTSPHKHRMRISLGIVDGKPASVLLSQSRVIDTKRLVNKIGFLNKKLFALVRKAAKDLL
ncbi:MAG: type II toxin-antitoxin system PemK/MazF family toxin [Patescibacteria group bacterium]